MAPRPRRQVPGQQSLFDSDDFNQLAARATERVRAQRAKEDARAAVSRRNLRSLSIAPVKEDLPPMQPFDSSRVESAGYSTQSHTLYVRFQDGTPWAYYNVEPNVWRNFKRSASQGKFINRVLNNYSYGRSNF